MEESVWRGQAPQQHFARKQREPNPATDANGHAPRSASHTTGHSVRNRRNKEFYEYTSRISSGRRNRRVASAARRPGPFAPRASASGSPPRESSRLRGAPSGCVGPAPVDARPPVGISTVPFRVCHMRAWLNVGEAAECAGVCKDTIYTACERNELRHARIGGRRCIRVRPGGSTSGTSATRGTCPAARVARSRRRRRSRQWAGSTRGTSWVCTSCASTKAATAIAASTRGGAASAACA